MRSESKILLNIIFLLAVLFCPVINEYSNNNTQATIIKHPAVDNFGENNSFSDVDFFDDVQITQNLDFFPESDYVFQIRIPQKCFLNSYHPSSIWQPPKSM